ncbi:YihY family inner membrane protein [Acidovorax sp. SUPP1855]|uniref:YihY family inner membrane protein n=1 Tax=Acidovorax sp. SUPP1855 TaxID=431774 RepID=UPI0023DE5E46|nr:YihY family inner membrane protein [Acidovorax sp. SUPP1855]GKS83720.1 YihY family inner membrane protein [Acidovorax sp. SUPP1855]
MPLAPLAQRFEAVLADLSHFPWRTTAHTLRERFREDRLGLTASSLTFTTLLALVPFFTVALAVFTAFPIFGTLQTGLQRWLVDSLVPDSISRQVLGYLTQFAAKASGLGVAGFSILLGTALALVLTIDRTLNNIWRVRRLRPLGQRVLIYWAVITLGPLVLAASLALTTSVASSASRGLHDALPDSARLLFDSIEFLLLAGGTAALYRYVPNTQVKWRHAWSGGVFVSLGIEVAKKVLGLYLASVPTYSVLYGAFATLPILLVWIYVAWVIVLLGAVVAAYLPSLLNGVARRASGQGWTFQLAVEALQALHRAHGTPARGLRMSALCQALRVDALQLEPVLEALTALDWVVQVNETAAGVPETVEPRYLLVADPAATSLEPLVQRLLIERADSLERFWGNTGVSVLKMADVLPRPA